MSWYSLTIVDAKKRAPPQYTLKREKAAPKALYLTPIILRHPPAHSSTAALVAIKTSQIQRKTYQP